MKNAVLCYERGMVMRRRFWLAPLVMVLLLALGLPAWAGVVQHGTIFRFSENINVPAGTTVNGDVVTINGHVTVSGRVTGNAVSVLGDVTVADGGTVMGDAVSVVGSLNLRSGSRVMGSQISILGGQRLFHGYQVNLPSVGRWLFDPARRLWGILVNLVLAILVAALFPRPVDRLKAKIQAEAGLSALMGLLGYVVVAPLMVLFAITIVGIPLTFLLGIGLWAGRLLGYTAIVLIVGEAVLRWINRTSDRVLVVALGVILLGVVTSIPLAGWLVSIVVSLVALGAAILTRLGTLAPESQGT